MRLGERGQADRARVMEPSGSAGAGAPQSSHREGARLRLRGTRTFSRQKKSAYGPRGFSNSWECFPERPAPRDTPCAPRPRRQHRSKGGRDHPGRLAPAVEHTAPREEAPPGQPKGSHRLLLIACGRAVADPAAGRGGVGRGPRAPCGERGEGPRTYLFLAPGRAGCMGCGPAWHSPAPPRVSSASAQRQDARGRSRVRCHILRAAGAPRLQDPEL